MFLRVSNPRYPVRALTSEQIEAIQQFSADAQLNYEHIVCLNCDSGRYKTLFTNDRYGIAQNTVMCVHCGLLYSNPRMTEESARYFYASDLYRRIYSSGKLVDRWYAANQTRGAPSYQEYYPALFFDFICSQDIHYDTVCEIGAGGGWNLTPFHASGKTTIGYEPSPALCEEASKRDIPVKNGFVDEIEGRYDLMLLNHVLEHLHNPLKVLNRIRRHVNRFLFIEVPGCVLRLPSLQSAHNFYFSPNTLQEITARAGFRTMTIDCCRDNDFIFGLFEKSENRVDFSYSVSQEKERVLAAYQAFRTRLLLRRWLEATGLSVVAKFLRSRR